MKTIARIITGYENQEHERLGQYFYNRYIAKDRWPELFFEQDFEKAKAIIENWLVCHQYQFEMPPKVRDL